MNKKKFYAILVAILLVLSFYFDSSQNQSFQQASFINIIIPIEIGTQNCVCKGGSCSEANWISFRRNCGDTTGWGNTNFACSRVDAGNCN